MYKLINKHSSIRCSRLGKQVTLIHHFVSAYLLLYKYIKDFLYIFENKDFCLSFQIVIIMKFVAKILIVIGYECARRKGK